MHATAFESREDARPETPQICLPLLTPLPSLRTLHVPVVVPAMSPTFGCGKHTSPSALRPDTAPRHLMPPPTCKDDSLLTVLFDRFCIQTC